MLHHETSHKVRAEQINSLRRLGSLAAQDSPLYAKILAAAKQVLRLQTVCSILENGLSYGLGYTA